MFKVKRNDYSYWDENKEVEVLNVYSVRESEEQRGDSYSGYYKETVIEFLIHSGNSWHWSNAENYEPYDESEDN